ncbi:very short patch repair endonuclease [Candidatus Riflebacteria bacterium]
MEKALKDKLKNGHFGSVNKKTSKLMKSVRSKGNKSTELRLKMSLIRAGVSGWQISPKSIKGKPDFYFKDLKIAIFVDGCFWHGCPSCGHVPKKNKEFWQEKFSRNKLRDNNTTLILKSRGFSVLRFWECELKTDLKYCLKQIILEINAIKMNNLEN